MTEGEMHTNLDGDMLSIEPEDLIQTEGTGVNSIAEAEGFYTDLETEVMLKSQDAGKDWNQEQIQAVTELAMGLHVQAVEEMGEFDPRKEFIRYAFSHFIPVILIIIAIAEVAISGFALPPAILALLAVALLAVV